MYQPRVGPSKYEIVAITIGVVLLIVLVLIVLLFTQKTYKTWKSKRKTTYKGQIMENTDEKAALVSNESTQEQHEVSFSKFWMNKRILDRDCVIDL